ncbi:nitronate monooxygenase [Proteiniclasticum sp. SCR006]|uniref:Probable nitronate monooxygenase n=1 Tax=Proteiniclasticum aestuarii TaxID=2817862 RepID=A0A939HBA1_9CLOT|nr:nitronate monooxygenase [Proteiniclasticum aestuarii]
MLNHLRIGNLVAKWPIIQGGMGIGISLSALAGAVAKEGGIGIISGVQIGYREADFQKNNLEANKRALREEIRKAREIAPEGIIGVNLLAAMTTYDELIRTAIEEGIDLIVTGAGLPLDLPKMVEGTETKIAPVVSSGKAARLISKVYDKKFGIPADMFIVEGPLAGGHLGFKKEVMESESYMDLEDILKEVLEAIRPFEEKYEVKIPVVVAGGIFDGKDIAHYLQLGASGVQMGTRFVATEECNADLDFKMSYVHARAEDIRLVKSPVGMPGRAISNSFTEKMDAGNIPVKRCYNCLIPCDPRTTPYCISDALIHSAEGTEGLIFAGANAFRVNEIISVKELMRKLIEETRDHMDSCN